MSKDKFTRVALMLPPDLIAAVDAWRRSEPDLPNRSEAIRRLIVQSIEKDHKLWNRSSS